MPHTCPVDVAREIERHWQRRLHAVQAHTVESDSVPAVRSIAAKHLAATLQSNQE